MKQKDFFENVLPSGFGEMMLFHFWYNNIKIGAFWCQSNLYIESSGSNRFLCNNFCRNKESAFYIILFMSIESSLPPRISFLPHLG
jgi:hypothetical protein